MAAQSRAVRTNGGIRWPVCAATITALAFSPSGATLAVAARDGVLRLLDYPKGTLAGGWKSYYGAFLSCAWSRDGQFVIAGGESDCVEVWSNEARRVVARGEGADTRYPPPSAATRGHQRCEPSATALATVAVMQQA